MRVLNMSEDALKGCRDAMQRVGGRRPARFTRALRRAEEAIEAIALLEER
jgi:hypothetical protein